jgi:glycosyltransferase involved in cell wall biosynthesis
VATFGIDARAATEVPAGRGRVVREILLALAAVDREHRFSLYCRSAWREAKLDERFQWVEIRAPDPIWHGMAAQRASCRCDAFLSTNSYLTAWALSVPCGVMVHDLVAFIPEARPQRRAATIERLTIGRAVRRADRLICNSESTRTDLERLFPAAAGKTGVISFGAGRSFAKHRDHAEIAAVARRYGATGGFVLATGTLEPRKNLRGLIRAHSALPPDLRETYPLLLVGPRGWEDDPILCAAREAGNHVLRAGFVPDDDLAALYSGCTVFCYPSLYEGFGLPVLEAMQTGAPVITSNVSSLPEVGGDAAAYVNPYDEADIRRSLERLLCSPEERARLAERGRRQAAGFSWERSARELLAQLEPLAAQAASRRS